jgi:hypothetical protein
MNNTVNLKDVIFEMFAGSEEVSVLICGQVERGADAHRDSQGLETETATAPDAFSTFIRINGKEYTDREAAELFDYTLEEWNDRCAAELINALEDRENAEKNGDCIDDYDDDLYF